MRPRQERDLPTDRSAPHASIVELPSADRLDGDSVRRNRTALLVLIVVAFMGLAYLKPWEPRDNRAPGGSQSAVPSAAPSPSPGRGLPIDWSLAASVVAPRDAWGLRALVLEDAVVPGGSPGATPGPARALPDRLAEVWVDAQPANLGGPKLQPSSPGQVVADAVLVPTGGSAVEAIGVTSPSGQPIIDVRLWQLVDGKATRVDIQDLPGTAPGLDRLLVPPVTLSRAGDWPAGTYRFDLLVGRRIVGLTMVLPPRPKNQGVIERIAQIASGLPQGLFVVRPESELPNADLTVRPVPETGVDNSSDANAWLQLGGADASTASAVAATLQADPSVLAVGIHGPVGEHLVTQIMVSLAPLADVSGTSGGVLVQSDSGDVAVFSLGAAGLQTGLFRVDTGWALQQGWRGRTWFLDVRGPGPLNSSTSPLLAAAREWSGWARTNVVLADGQPPVTQIPDAVAPDPDALGSSCFGGVMVHDGRKVIGIGYSAAAPASVLVHRLFTGNRTVPVSAAVAADTVPGLLLMAEARHDTWQPGYYEVTLEQGTAADTFVFCVGSTNSDGAIAVPDGAASVDAYRQALGP